MNSELCLLILFCFVIFWIGFYNCFKLWCDTSITKTRMIYTQVEKLEEDAFDGD